MQLLRLSLPTSLRNYWGHSLYHNLCLFLGGPLRHSMICLLAIMWILLLSIPLQAATPQDSKQSSSPLTSNGTDNATLTPPLTFRHSVELFIPAFGLTLPFDGLIEMSPTTSEYKALGTLRSGLTLFISSGSSTSHTLHNVHPSVARLPHFEKNLTEVLHLLNSALPSALIHNAENNEHTDFTGKYALNANGRTYSITHLGKRITTIKEAGPHGEWVLNAYYALSPLQIHLVNGIVSEEIEYPSQIFIQSITHDYKVQINVITARQ